jgi:phospholipid transport system substrate-binding protein
MDLRGIANLAVVSVLLWSGFGNDARACADSPAASVERFHAALLATMKDAKTLGAGGRYERLAPDVTACFDLRLMSRVATDAAWRSGSEAERDALVGAFSRMSIATYANQFDGFDGESFETQGVSDGPQATKLVRTRIVLPKKNPVPLVYVMKMGGNDGLWRVADILLDGDISQLATRRSEYRMTLKEGGLARLVETLNTKADELLAK